MNSQNRATMGTMISSLRKEHGMTQAELAKEMNVTDKAVSKWERDLSCPDIKSLPKLAEIFGISVDELMQVTSVEKTHTPGETVNSITDLVLKALTTAMGVSVFVLSAMGKLDLSTGFTLLGLGLTSVGIYLLRSVNK